MRSWWIIFGHPENGASLSCLRIADDLVFDAVWVEEIEAAARLVVGVAEGLEPGCDHACLGCVEIVDFDPDVVQRRALGKGLWDWSRAARSVEGNVMLARPNMDRMSAVLRRAAPTDVPIKQCLHQGRRARGVRDRDVHVLNAE